MLMSALQPNSFQSLSFILFLCHAHERPPIRYFRNSSRLSGVVLTRFGVKRDVALLASARLVRVGNTFSACSYWLLKTLYPTNPESKSTRGRGAAPPATDICNESPRLLSNSFFLAGRATLTIPSVLH
jgi:hypothetical protein